MRKVITYGTFDLFHMGHLRLLERLREMGDHLTVAVSSDAFNAGKGKSATVCYEERAHILRALRCVDDVIAEDAWEQKADDIRRLGIHVFGMGSDWDGKFDDLKALCEVVYLPRTEGISTSLIKESIVSPTPVRVAASR
ncbi:adenylyltransferase/cytidyltransferase family protein [Brevundimonas sp.]|uniref:adenylyltransferase/cytidyltransferase family protein n=1 Tax=Brevundimonas sp. TaxID=1871086 RepID=UPI0035B31536